MAEYILVLEGIDGESKKDGYIGKIDIDLFSWGGSRSGTFQRGGGGTGGEPTFSDISISKVLDKASPLLRTLMANGKHIPTGKIVCRKSGETLQEFEVMELKKIIVSSFQMGGGGGSDAISEHFTLNFAVIEETYKEQSDDGALLAESQFKWDIPAGIPT